jgi:hypothetical protein
LNRLALNAHLARYLSASPIRDVDPICLSLVRYLHRFDPSLDTIQNNAFRLAAQERLREDGHIQRYMKFTPSRG